MLDQLETTQDVQESTSVEPSQNVEQQAENVQREETPKEINLRILRERAEAAERRAYELEMAIKHHAKSAEPEEEDDEFTINDDSFVEGKDVKKYFKTIKKELKNTRKQLEQFHQKTALEQAELRLKSQFSDFDNVVTQENIQKLAQTKPVSYRSIMANADIYDRGYIAYELLKSSGILNDNYQAIDKKIEQNKGKPRSSANVSPQASETPLTRVGDYDRRVLTEERKEQLRRQVEEAKRNKI